MSKPNPDSLVICRQHQLDELTAKRSRVRELAKDLREAEATINELRQENLYLRNQIEAVKRFVLTLEDQINKCLPLLGHYVKHFLLNIKSMFWMHKQQKSPSE